MRLVLEIAIVLAVIVAEVSLVAIASNVHFIAMDILSVRKSIDRFFWRLR